MVVAYHVIRSEVMIYRFLTSQCRLECFRHRGENIRDPGEVSDKAAGNGRGSRRAVEQSAKGPELVAIQSAACECIGFPIDTSQTPSAYLSAYPSAYLSVDYTSL